MKQVSKTILTTIATIAALNAGQQAVQAEELSKADPQKTEVDQVQKEVTQAGVTASQTKVIAANGAVKAQETTVAAAKQEVVVAEKKASTAQTNLSQAEKVAAEATPGNISKAEQTVKNTQTAVENAEKAVTASQAAQTQAQSSVSNQEKITKQAQEAVKAKQGEVSKAEEKVAEKQAILDGTGTKEIIEKAEQTQAKVNIDKAAVQKAQADLVEAKQADRKRAGDLADAEKKLVQTQITTDASKSDLDKKVAMASKTAEALEKATVDLTKANHKAEAINTITLSQDYIAALREYNQNFTKYSKAELKTQTDKLVAMGKALAKQNQFKANQDDSDLDTLDLNHLPAEVREEMSLFAADLLNQIRAAFGTAKVEVSKGAVEAVNEHVSTSKTNGVKGHDRANLDRVLAKVGITSGTEESIGLMGGSGSARKQQKISPRELKRLIYNNILNLMFNAFEDVEDNENNEFLHAGTLAGLSESGVKKAYLGVGTSYKDDFWQVVNFLFVYDKALTQPNTFDAKALSNPFDSKEVLVRQKAAQSAYDLTKKADEQAKANQAQAETDYQKAKEKLALVTAKRDSLKAETPLTPAAETALTKAQATLKVDEAENKAAQEAVKQLTADVKAKQAALAQAKAELTQTETELKALEAILSTEQYTLVAKQATLAQARSLVEQREAELVQVKEHRTKAQAVVFQLKAAPAMLKQAQMAYRSAKQMLFEKKEILGREEAKLTVLKAEQAEVTKQHQTLVKIYQEQLEVQRQAKLAEQKAVIEKAGGQAVPVFDETGKLVSYENMHKQDTQSPVGIQSTVKPVRVNYNTHFKKTLPSTGEKGSILSAIGGLLLVGFSFVGYKRKEVK
ncbi:SEC10/PgrA surface exclusion domain-containing protein [Streptococcus anginosus]|uniref:SEC10/PgrA surface exclusion domain-containing protein n=1 Tax=Streptococcus anginosus TaxID=1328 RepID=UPI0029C14BE5|nr:SEC10/PgrA surface exclusion domain-containing protein [Streptococcus anginosus]MDX5016344.1 SEC10/PgrA surface exclusion domain-containing protein [Streptococcus anginosus]MDX5020412.1 SEC10/PgrA surface exclusion domain-containing protein [Streptococcus anginosus]